MKFFGFLGIPMGLSVLKEAENKLILMKKTFFQLK